MSFLNSKITLSASNLFSLKIINQALTYLLGNGAYRISNLSLNPSKQKLYDTPYLRITIEGRVTTNEQLCVTLNSTFNIQKSQEVWQLITSLVEIKVGYLAEKITLKFKENNVIEAYADLDQAKIDDLRKRVL